MRNLLLFLALVSTCNANNWYVEPSAQGATNGTSWSNAWSMGNLNSNWSKVAPGDVVWIAGGKYTTGMQPGTNGTDAAPIVVNRVRSTDKVPTASPGWSSSFDSQVLIEPSGGDSPLSFGTQGSYFTFDGRVLLGIKFYSDSSQNASNNSNSPYGAVTVGYGAGGVKGVTIRNCDLAGPGQGNGTYNQQGSMYVVSIWGWNGSTYLGISNWLFDHCDIHGGVDAFSAISMNNTTIQYCNIYGISSNNSSYHSNLMELHSCSNDVFRYNNVHDWQVEGFFFLSPSNGPDGRWDIYGNLFYNNSSDSGRYMELEGSAPSGVGPIYTYNNIFYGLTLCVFSGAGSSAGSYNSSGKVSNNIFYNCGGGTGGVFQRWNGSHDHNYYGGRNGIEGNESGGITGPWPCANTTDFTPIDNAVTLGKGANLGAPYNVDKLGVTRSGAWDIGAYQYGTAGPTPTATPYPTATPTPTATPKPTPTPTPKPTPTPTPSPTFKVGGTAKVTTESLNVRQTPAGTYLGVQAVGAVGNIVDGPQSAPFNGIAVTWWKLTFPTGSSGWAGQDNLVAGPAPTPSPTPTPTPTPKPTPAPTYKTWVARLNAEIANGVSADNLLKWIQANPPTVDTSSPTKAAPVQHKSKKPEGEMQKIGRTLDKVL